METDIVTLIKAIVLPLANDKDQVQVRVEDEADCLVYELSLSTADAGRVIGKQGRVAQAIRTIVYLENDQNSKRVKLNIVPITTD